jgi:hypothetical protein
MAKKPTCGTCRYSFNWIMTKHSPPKINTRYSGRCSYVVPEPVWPLSIRGEWRDMPTTGGVQATGTETPAASGLTFIKEIWYE